MSLRAAQWARGAVLALSLTVGVVGADLAAPITFVRTGLPHDALFDIAFFERDGLAVGSHGVVLSSADGGLSWAPSEPLGSLALTSVAVNAATP